MLWGTNTEIDFFRSALSKFAAPEQLFYKLDDRYFAYIPKGESAEGKTLQSRNALIGSYTERWCKNLFSTIAEEMGLFAVNSVVCEEIGLTSNSSADLAFCTNQNSVQEPGDIKLIFEIKMSVVSNYEYLSSDKIIYLGDYKTHKGTPSILRSDSMLKAIGKAINIRVSGEASTHIPVIILGNSPITKNYHHKVDYLKKAGVVQGFVSLFPNPTTTEFTRQTSGNGFMTISNFSDLKVICKTLIEKEYNFFSAMMTKKRIGEIIRIAGNEPTDVSRAEKFLELLNEFNGKD